MIQELGFKPYELEKSECGSVSLGLNIQIGCKRLNFERWVLEFILLKSVDKKLELKKREGFKTAGKVSM